MRQLRRKRRMREWSGAKLGPRCHTIATRPGSADSASPIAPSADFQMSSHMHAAVDREVRACDETRIVRTEKRNERRDLVRLT